jgi:hypothetical protein
VTVAEGPVRCSNSAGHYAACRLKILGARATNYLRTLTKQFPPT